MSLSNEFVLAVNPQLPVEGFVLPDLKIHPCMSHCEISNVVVVVVVVLPVVDPASLVKVFNFCLRLASLYCLYCSN